MLNDKSKVRRFWEINHVFVKGSFFVCGFKCAHLKHPTCFCHVEFVTEVNLLLNSLL